MSTPESLKLCFDDESLPGPAQTLNGLWQRQVVPWQANQGNWVQITPSGTGWREHLSYINQPSPQESRCSIDTERVGDDVPVEVYGPNQNESSNHEELPGVDITDADLFEGVVSPINEQLSTHVRRRSARVRFGGVEYFQETANGYHYHFVPLTLRVPVLDLAIGDYHVNVMSQPRHVSEHVYKQDMVHGYRPARRACILTFWFAIVCLLLGAWALGIRWLHGHMSRLP